MCGTGCLLIVQNFTAEIVYYKFDLENRDLGHNQAWLPLHVYMTLFPPLMTNPPPLPDASVREASPRFGIVTAWQAPLHKSTTDRRPRNHIRVLLAGFVLGLSLDTSPPAEVISFLRALNDFGLIGGYVHAKIVGFIGAGPPLGGAGTDLAGRGSGGDPGRELA